MLRRIITLIALSLLLVGPAFAKDKFSCDVDDTSGSFTRIDPTNTGPDGSLRTYVRQLNLNSGGAAYQFITGVPDFLLATGTRSPYVGSWECREDGKLLATFLQSVYVPTTDLGIDDVELVGHQVITYLMTVENDDLLKLIQSRARTYFMGEDPTDPLGGHLGSEFFSDIPYVRLKPTDADLTP
jgi:hypothetical protein